MVDMHATIIERHKQSALSHYARALPWIWGKYTVLTESKTSNFEENELEWFKTGLLEVFLKGPKPQ